MKITVALYYESEEPVEVIKTSLDRLPAIINVFMRDDNGEVVEVREFRRWIDDELEVE